MQEKENGDKILAPMEPSSTSDNQRGMSLSDAENSFNGVKYTPSGDFGGIEQKGRAKSGKPPKNKTKSVLVVERRTEARPLQELLHLKQEPFLLRELLQMKEETAPSFTKKVSQILKKPLDLIQKRQLKPVQKPLMQQLSSKLPEAHVLIPDIQREIFDAVRFVSPIAMSRRYMYRGPVAFEEHVYYPHSSEKQDCNGKENGVNRSEPNGSKKRKAVHVAGDTLDRELMNNDGCHVFQSEPDPSKCTQELQNQHINVDIISDSDNFLRRAGSLSERTLPVCRSHSKKEGLTSRFLCFGLEFVQHQTSDKGMVTKLERVLSPSRTCEANHAPPGSREDCPPQKNKVYPSGNTERSFLSIEQDSSMGGNKITREHNHDPNTDGTSYVAATRPIFDLKESLAKVITHTHPNLPSKTDCCLIAMNRVNTLRDILRTSQEEEFLSVLHRGGLSETRNQIRHLDLKCLDSTSTCSYASFASKWAIKPQVVHYSDHEEIEYEEVPSPDLQGRTLCNGVEGSKSMSGCKVLEDNGHPSPVCVLDSPFIDEILSPEEAERFSESKNQIINDHRFSRCQLIWKMATAETSIGRSDDTCSSWEEYYVLEKAVETLLHGSIIEDAYNSWYRDSKWCLQDAHLSDGSPETATSLRQHSYNPDLLKEAIYQESMLRGHEVLELKATSGEYAFFNGRRMLEELSDSQMLLDCVTEALESLDLRESCYMFGNSSIYGLHKRTTSRRKFVNDIYQTICSWHGKPAANINGIVEEDLNCKWMSIKSELLEIGLEIECTLFEILINDAIFDILDLEVKI